MSTCECMDQPGYCNIASNIFNQIEQNTFRPTEEFPLMDAEHQIKNVAAFYQHSLASINELGCRHPELAQAAIINFIDYVQALFPEEDFSFPNQ